MIRSPSKSSTKTADTARSGRTHAAASNVVGPRSRPGPRTDLDVRSMLLDTAERMYATNGVGADSLRAIAREAGVSSAAVFYHFPNKQALIAAVVSRRGEASSRQMRERLTSLIESSRPVSAREVVDAVLLPFVEMIEAEPRAGLYWVKVVTQLANNRDAAWADLNDGDPSAYELFQAAASRAFDNRTSSAMQFRLGIAMYSMLGSLANADRGEPTDKIGSSGFNPVFVEELARFTASGLAAD